MDRPIVEGCDIKRCAKEAQKIGLQYRLNMILVLQSYRVYREVRLVFGLAVDSCILGGHHTMHLMKYSSAKCSPNSVFSVCWATEPETVSS